MTAKIDTIHISRTYAGCYEGRPDQKTMVSIAERKAAKLNTSAPTHALVSTAKEPRMPEWQYIVHLSSYDTVRGSDADGSHLIIIWWDDELNGSIDNLLAHTNPVDWEKHANNWWL